MEELQTVEELGIALAEYRAQLEQVEALLSSEPSNIEAQEVQTQLLEVVQLTEELIQMSSTSADDATSAHAEPETSEAEIPLIGPLPPTAAVVGPPGPAAVELLSGSELDPDGARTEQPGGPTKSSGDPTEPLDHPGEGRTTTSMPTVSIPQPERAVGIDRGFLEGEHGGRGGGRKRGRRGEMHPRNKYAELAPDFDELADKYPSFRPYVMGVSGGRRSIEWTDYNATRELTRALLHHDYGVTWTLPDGHLCPTVPNRANYIHWIEDLLSLFPRPSGKRSKGGRANNQMHDVTGIDIGTGANCIYPLLGASINGWRFVATDITEAALNGATSNVESNPHLSGLIELRDARWRHSNNPATPAVRLGREEEAAVLAGVVAEAERFDFCMCNPPFFERMDEANANPKTACGGTETEMVCAGGEEGFVRRIVADSLLLKDQIHWYTTMIGRKVNLNTLVDLLRKRRVPTIRTTEFVQGRTSRWGLAWSFAPEPPRDLLRARSGAPAPPRSKLSFTLEGLGRHCQASDVLTALSSQLTSLGASCSHDTQQFTITGSAPLETATWHDQSTSSDRHVITRTSPHPEGAGESGIDGPDFPAPGYRERQNGDGGRDAKGEEGFREKGRGGRFGFQVSIFQQAPGALSVAASLAKKDAGSSEMGAEGAFSTLFERAECALRARYKPSTLQPRT